VESVLLQECWKLIQQGTSRKHITIRRSEIYVGKLLHAKVIDQKLVLYRSPEETTDINSLPLKQKWNMLKSNSQILTTPPHPVD